MEIIATGANGVSWMQQAEDRVFGISGFEFWVLPV
jgi:hypothetical protein